MIKVDRPKDSAPKGFAAAGVKERRRNRIAKIANEKLKFAAYSTKSVRDKLDKLFGRKCAFCESILAGTQSGDIEHFRPKGAVIVESAVPGGDPIKKDGYYWLAAKWPNLLISCADCNRPRTQPDYDNRKRGIGNANYFPRDDESQRATGPRGLRNEEPLLLNPCVDDPAEHLVFLDDGRIEPAIIAGQLSPKGVASIRYLGLARAELLQMRARHRRVVMSAIRHTFAAMKEGRDPGTDLEDLVKLLSPDEAYVAYTRALVREHMSPYLEELRFAIEG
ncbi:hypothetical protein [Pseudomonas viridiflava]|uniref:hypothetical protein n=1 Tax=Pseudomonas viridiflava TaxID=33069 RepID=UPI000F07C238|nr:hypothetical protein [Pseudomonas viridiflava]